MPSDTTPTDQPSHLIHNMPVQVADVSELNPFPGNPRKGDTSLIAQSLHQHGQYKPLIVQTSTGNVIAGNNTLTAAVEQGWQRIAVQYLDVSDEQAARINLVDNRANDRATYDDRMLLEMLAELPDLDGTGYDPGDMDALQAMLDAPSAATSDMSDEDILGETDQAAWPTIKAQVSPEIHRRWTALPGGDDAARVAHVLDQIGA